MIDDSPRRHSDKATSHNRLSIYLTWRSLNYWELKDTVFSSTCTMLGYEFITLTPDQIELRRKALDALGFETLGLVYAPKLAKDAYDMLLSSKNGRGRSIPRLNNILDTTYIPEFGPLRVQLVGLIWTVFFVWRIQHTSGIDYMHLTKAFGQVGAAQIPFQYFLMLSRNFPAAFSNSVTDEELNSFHRLLGRIVHAFLIAHGSLYLWFFIKQGILIKRLGDLDVRMGILALVSLTLLSLLALPVVRKRAYFRVFFRSHVVLNLAVLGALFFHTKHGRLYVWVSLAMWSLNVFSRMVYGHDAVVRCEALGNSLVRVRAKVKAMSDVRFASKICMPGCYVYIKMPGLGPHAPFSLVNASTRSDGSTEIELVVKETGGPMTKGLSACAQQGKILNIRLIGPFGDMLIYNKELALAASTAESRILLVAGGVGATYILPIYVDLCKTRLQAGRDTRDICAIWIVRTLQETLWAETSFSNGSVLSNTSIYVTQPSAREVLDNKVQPRFSQGRPEFSQIVSGFLAREGARSEKELSADRQQRMLSSSMTVVVCGPKGLSTSLRTAVADCTALKGKEIRWLEEQFGFGGS